jgi:hypothetical protein
MLKDLAAVDSKSDSIDLAVVVRAKGSCEGRGRGVELYVL